MPVLMPPQEYLDDPVKLLALAVWRESRSEPMPAKVGVVWTIKNRCAMAPAQGFKKDIAGNVLKPWAFSSFMMGDPNSVKYPQESDPSWQDSLAAARTIEEDPIGGAVFYHDTSLVGPPTAWGNVQETTTIGRLKFYKIAA